MPFVDCRPFGVVPMVDAFCVLAIALAASDQVAQSNHKPGFRHDEQGLITDSERGVFLAFGIAGAALNVRLAIA